MKIFCLSSLVFLCLFSSFSSGLHGAVVHIEGDEQQPRSPSFVTELPAIWSLAPTRTPVSAVRVADLEKEVIEKPMSPDARVLLGNAYQRGGRPDKAAHQFWLASRLAPENIQILDRFAYSLLTLSDYERALMLYDHIIELTASDSKSAFNRGAALYYLGEHQAALQVWRTYMEAHPDDTATRYNIAASLVAMGRWSEGLEALRDFTMSFHPLPILLAALYHPLTAQDRTEDAANIRRLLMETTETALAENLLRTTEPPVLFKE